MVHVVEQRVRREESGLQRCELGHSACRAVQRNSLVGVALPALLISMGHTARLSTQRLPAATVTKCRLSRINSSDKHTSSNGERCAAWTSGLARCLSRYDDDNDDDNDDDYDDDYDVLCLSLAAMLLLYVRPCMRPCETLLFMR